MVVVGGLLSVGGLVMALSTRGAERGAGAAIALFFLACLLVAPLFAPGRRGGPVRLETARLGGRYERGILVPYSGLRMAIVLGAIACLALPMLGFVVFADAFADDPGESPWPVRLVGAVGTVFFGLGGILAADVTLSFRTLDIDPALLYEALRYYHEHPQARAELATEDGLSRLRHGQFTSTQPASQ
jgi:hypothetical protein